MADPVDFKGSNLVLGAPEGVENVSPLPVFRTQAQVISCWKLSVAELAEVNRTGCVYLAVMGHTQPPVYLASEKAMRGFAKPFGVWPE